MLPKVQVVRWSKCFKLGRIKYFSTSEDGVLPPFLHSRGIDPIASSKINVKDSSESILFDENVLPNVSSEVMFSMISEGFRKKDYKTVKIVITEAVKLGKLSSEVVSSCIVDRVIRQKAYHAMIMFQVALEHQIDVPSDICHQLLSFLVNKSLFIEAEAVAGHMVASMHPIQERHVHLILAGLMNTPNTGIPALIRFLRLMAIYQRDDIAKSFQVAKVVFRVYSSY